MARCIATTFCLPPSQDDGKNRGRVYLLKERNSAACVVI